MGDGRGPKTTWGKERDWSEQQQAVLRLLREPEGEEMLESHHNEVRLLEEGVPGVGIRMK